jgi:tetratricopeptide (TPR) repeat protein
VGRPERIITGDVTPLTEFARGLRGLRRAAGSPSYRRLSAGTHFSPSTLARAAAGQALPSLEVTLAYVTACGGEAAEWEARRAEAASWLRSQDARPAVSQASARAAVPVPPGPPGRPAQLPPDTADFTGREEQVGLLCGLLGAEPAVGRPGAVAISAVAGMGGIGKTALAVHVAHRLTSRFPDGQLYADLLGATRPVRPVEVLGRFLRDLGVPDEEVPGDEPGCAARYRTLLASRRMLVVLDDAAEAAQVRPLLPGTATCGVIITGRRTLTGLPGTALLDLEVLGEGEARELFGAIAGPGRAAAEPEATARVLACCGGLPLAVRIAASRLASRPGWSVAFLAAKLTDERSRLAELTAGDLAVRASFAVSYDALPAQADGAGPARVFRLLGLAEMTTSSLNAVAALAGTPQAEVAAALETLTDAHLLQAPAPDRYRLHDLLRSYAADLARRDDSEPQRDEALRRLLRWYAEQATRAARAVVPRLPASPLFETAGLPAMASPAQAIGWFRAELASLVAAVRQAAGRGWHDLVVGIAVPLWAFFTRYPHPDDWIATSQAGVASARQLGDAAALGWLMSGLGHAYTGLGRFDEARATLTAALDVRRRCGDRTGEATTLASLGQILGYQGRFREALDYMLPSLAMHIAVGERRMIGTGHHNVGCMLWRLGRYDEALDHSARALAIRREEGDRFGEGMTGTQIADVYLSLGRLEESVENNRQALAAIEDAAAGSFEHADVLYGLGTTLAAMGHTAEAREAWQAALPILDRCTDHRVAGLRARIADAQARQQVP